MNSCLTNHLADVLPLGVSVSQRFHTSSRSQQNQFGYPLWEGGSSHELEILGLSELVAC